MSTLLNAYLVCHCVSGIAALIAAPRVHRGLRKLREDFDSAERYGGFQHQRITDEAVDFDVSARDEGFRSAIADTEAAVARSWTTPEADGLPVPTSWNYVETERREQIARLFDVPPDLVTAIAANTRIPETRYWQTMRNSQKRQMCLWSDCTDLAKPGQFYCRGHLPIMSGEAL